MNKTTDVIIYCDGACSGNPGPGGWGSIVTFNGLTVELSERSTATTNNRMEMSAVIVSLKYIFTLKELNQIQKILILTDSVYVIRGMTQWIFGWKKRGWKTAENADVSNKELWQQLDLVIQQLKTKINNLNISRTSCERSNLRAIAWKIPVTACLGK